MKPALLAVLCFYAPLLLWSQTIPTGQWIIKRKCGSDHIHLFPDKAGKNLPPLFYAIQVLDARPDTTRIGIVHNKYFNEQQILSESPVALELSRYLNNSYASSKGGKELLIVLKNLWIVNANNRTIPRAAFEFRFHVEAYLNATGGYEPLFSTDTIVGEPKGETAATQAGKEIRNLFGVCMKRIAGLDLMTTRKVVSRKQIDSFNLTRFSYPMDTAKLLLQGAYAGIEEFLNNTPSIPKAELSRDNTGNFTLRIPDETGQFYYTHRVWGYCDGTQTYVMMDGNLFPIFSVNHQFYVLGSKEYASNGAIIPLYLLFGDLAAATLSPATIGLTRSLRVFRLDLESGKVVD